MRISSRSVFYNVFTLTMSNIALQVLGFIYRIIMSRLTGAEGMGVYQLAAPYYSVLMAITLSGLTMAISRLSAEHAAFGDSSGSRRTMRLCFILFFSLLTAAAIPTLLYSDFISTHLLGDARVRLTLLLFLPCLFFTGIENLIKNYFFGINHLKPPIISELTEQTVRIISVGGLLLTLKPADPGRAAALVALGMVISEVVSALLLSCFYRKYAPRLPDNTRAARARIAPKILRIALPVSAASLLNNLLNSFNSVLIPRRLIASGMAPGDAICLFGTLFGMTMPLLTFPIAFISPLNTVTVPKLSEGMAVKNMADVRRKAGKAIHSTGLLAFPAAALFIPLGAPLCTLIYKDPSAGTYMLPLCIATLFSYYQITTTAILNGIGEQRRAAAGILLGGVIELAFTWSVGFKGVGIYGFLTGYIIASAVGATMNLFRIIKNLGLTVRWRNWFVTPFLSAALAGLSANLLYSMLRSEELPAMYALPLCLAVSAATYIAALRTQGTHPLKYLSTLKPHI